MSDEDKLIRSIGRAARAQALIDDELLQESFATLEARYIEHWKSGPDLHDVAGRERLWAAVQIVGKVRSQLMTMISDGKVARGDMDAIAEKRRRFGLKSPF